jgi:hypothetical protein
MNMTPSTVREAKPAGLLTFQDVSKNNPLITRSALTNSRAHSNSKQGRLVKVHERKVGNLEITDDSLTWFFNPKLNLTFLL